MDRVTSAQYLAMKDSFTRDNIEVDVAFTPAGDVHHIHRAGRVLAIDREDTIQRLQAALPGLRPADQAEQPQIDGTELVVLSIDDVEGGHLTVPEALDLIDESLGDDNPALGGGEPLVTPAHVVHITRVCPAGGTGGAERVSGPAVASTSPGWRGSSGCAARGVRYRLPGEPGPRPLSMAGSRRRGSRSARAEAAR